MKKTSNLKYVLGLSDRETAKIDMDDVTFKTVRYWAFRAMKWFKLQGFIILKSSKKRYHVIFNRVVSWAENMKVVAWVALLSHNKGLHTWLIMQLIKGSSTLRVCPKKDKPSPRIVSRHGEQDGQIKEWLVYRRMVKDIWRDAEKYTKLEEKIQKV